MVKAEKKQGRAYLRTILFSTVRPIIFAALLSFFTTLEMADSFSPFCCIRHAVSAMWKFSLSCELTRKRFSNHTSTRQCRRRGERHDHNCCTTSKEEPKQTNKTNGPSTSSRISFPFGHPVQEKSSSPFPKRERTLPDSRYPPHSGLHLHHLQKTFRLHSAPMTGMMRRGQHLVEVCCSLVRLKKNAESSQQTKGETITIKFSLATIKR